MPQPKPKPKKPKSKSGASPEEEFGPAKKSGLKGGDIIQVLSLNNPMKPGTKSAEEFGKYNTGMTVAEFQLAAGANAKKYIAHDLKKGYISIHAPKSLK